MSTTERSTSSKVARIAGILAIAAWPIALLVGVALSSGQDSAGAAMAQGLALVGAAGTSLIATLIYAIARWELGPHLAKRHGRKLLLTVAIAAAALATWYGLPPLGGQHYAVRVSNQTADVITDVAVAMGNTQARFDSIAPQTSRELTGFTARPSDAVSVTWTDATGQPREISTLFLGEVPRVYDGGFLLLTAISEDAAIAMFLFPSS